MAFQCSPYLLHSFSLCTLTEYPSQRKFRNIQGKKFYLPNSISPFSFSQNPSWPVTQIKILWKTRRNPQFSRTIPSESMHGPPQYLTASLKPNIKRIYISFPFDINTNSQFWRSFIDFQDPVQICLSDEAIISNVINIPEKFSSPLISCANSCSNLKKNTKNKTETFWTFYLRIKMKSPVYHENAHFNGTFVHCHRNIFLTYRSSS